MGTAETLSSKTNGPPAVVELGCAIHLHDQAEFARERVSGALIWTRGRAQGLGLALGASPGSSARLRLDRFINLQEITQKHTPNIAMTNIIETDNMKKYRISGFRAFQKWDLTSYNASFRHAEQSLLTHFFQARGTRARAAQFYGASAKTEICSVLYCKCH